MKKIVLVCILLFIWSITVNAQILKPVTWSYGAKKISKTEAVVFIRATIDEDWHVYSQTVPDGGPIKTSFNFEKGKGYTILGTTIEPKPIVRFEKVFGIEVSYFEKSVIFQQKVKLTSAEPVTVKGSLQFMTCNDEKCLPPETVTFAVLVK